MMLNLNVKYQIYQRSPLGTSKTIYVMINSTKPTVPGGRRLHRRLMLKNHHQAHSTQLIIIHQSTRSIPDRHKLLQTITYPSPSVSEQHDANYTTTPPHHITATVSHTHTHAATLYPTTTSATHPHHHEVMLIHSITTVATSTNHVLLLATPTGFNL